MDTAPYLLSGDTWCLHSGLRSHVLALRCGICRGDLQRGICHIANRILYSSHGTRHNHACCWIRTSNDLPDRKPKVSMDWIPNHLWHRGWPCVPTDIHRCADCTAGAICSDSSGMLKFHAGAWRRRCTNARAKCIPQSHSVENTQDSTWFGAGSDC